MHQPPYPTRPALPLPLPAVPWYRKPALLILVSGVATVALVFSCFTALVIYGASLPPLPTPTQTPFVLVTSTAVPLRATQPVALGTPTVTVTAQPSPTAAARPAATPTPAPHAITAATLGGIPLSFAERYFDTGGDVYTGTVNGVAQVTIFIALMPAQDGSAHVYSIIIQPTSGSPDWDATTATQAVVGLVPTDNTFEYDVSWPNGIEHVYRSADLAATFPSADFTNDAGTQQVPPGTFDWQCVLDGAGPGYNSCIISIGNR